MFRVTVGVTGDAGRQRRHFSAKAARLPCTTRWGVSRDGGCVRMDSGGRVFKCVSHDIMIASPQRNTMHGACWRPSLCQTLRFLLIKMLMSHRNKFLLVLFKHFSLAREDHQLRFKRTRANHALLCVSRALTPPPSSFVPGQGDTSQSRLAPLPPCARRWWGA